MRRLSIIIIAFFVVVSSSGVAAAADGTLVEGDSTFEVRAGDGVVHANINVTITNTVLPGQTDGQPRPAPTSLSIPIAAQTRNVTATSGGTRLGVNVVPVNRSFATAVVTFPQILPGQRRLLTLSYDMVASPAGSTNPIRINPAYAGFFVFGVGDEFNGFVHVVVPERNQTEVLYVPSVAARVGTTNVLTMSLPSGNEFAAIVSTFDETALTSVDADVGPRDLLVRGWPGDTAWQQFALNGIRTDLPALERLVGRPWPVDGQLTVLESMKPRLAGYDATFDRPSNTIEIGDELDEEALVHQFAHAWFDDEVFEQRWIKEAFAIDLADRALASRGIQVPVPAAPTSTDTGKMPLDAWSDIGTSAAERYGYDTSAWLMHQIVDEIGLDATRRVIDAALSHTTAYGLTQREPERNTLDSAQMLDLFEDVGGSKKASALFATYVFDDSEPMAQRTIARAASSDLVKASGDWKLPASIRQAMSDPRYGDALQQIEQARNLLRTRDEIEGLTAQFGGAPAAEFRLQYENATDNLSRADEFATKELGAAKAIVNAQARLAEGRGVFDRVGLLFASPGAKLERSKKYFSAGNITAVQGEVGALERQLDGARLEGIKRLLMVFAAVAVFAGIIKVGGRSRGRERDAMTERERVALAIADRTTPR